MKATYPFVFMQNKLVYHINSVIYPFIYSPKRDYHFQLPIEINPSTLSLSLSLLLARSSGFFILSEGGDGVSFGRSIGLHRDNLGPAGAAVHHRV